MTRAINGKIEEVGGTELQKEMLEVAKKKHEKKLIRARSQFESFSQASSEGPIVRATTANSRLGSQASKIRSLKKKKSKSEISSNHSPS